MLRLGIDLGGSKTEIIALDAQGRELLRERVATPAGDYRATVAMIGELVARAERTLGSRGTVGVGTPGAVSLASGRIKNANSTCLNDRPLQKDLEELLGREVRIANDANCFALSEATDGAAAGAGIVFGVILGTGVGGAIVVSGRVLVGANGIAGEWGHNPLPLPGAEDLPLPSCYCGRSGCIETYLSGPGLSRLHLEATGRAMSPAEIVSAAASGDSRSEATLSRYEERLARSFANVINIVDPDTIVIGGGLSNIDRLYDSIPRLWRAYVFSDDVRTRLVRNRHGDSGGVRGAAWLWGM